MHFRSLVDPLSFPPSDESVRQQLEDVPAEELRQRLLELDPDAAGRVDLDNPRRVVRALEIALITGDTPTQRARSPEARAVSNYEPEVDFVAIGLDPGSELPDRVEARFDRMLALGLIDEVRRLRHRMGRLAAQAVGYRQLIPVIDGAADLGTGRTEAIRATRSLAKRQRTFFLP